MVETSHPQLSIVRQCALLHIGRSGRYYRPTGESAQTLALMRLIDEAFLAARQQSCPVVLPHSEMLLRCRVSLQPKAPFLLALSQVLEHPLARLMPGRTRRRMLLNLPPPWP